MPSLRARRPDEELVLDNLGALVPVSVLQQVQDAFSSALHVPFLFVTEDGWPITRSSGLETFCSQLTRKLEAKRPCTNCSRTERGYTEDETPQPFDCPLGLRDVALPITAGDRKVGYLLTTQTTSEPGAPHIVEAACKHGMTPAAAASYASRIPVESPERLAEIAQALSSLAKIISELATNARENRLSAVTDPLTGAANRTRFWECLSREIEIADTHNYPVSVLLIDLDDFKMINNAYGHETGDKVLQAVGQVLTHEIRTSDLAARYGSDAFLVMLRCTDPTGANIVAWRLRNKIADCKITARGQKVPVSASIGQVTYPLCAARDPDALFKEALNALNENRGRTQAAELQRAA
jgi:diguanylate cyclase (GGDEF)-like protein